MTDPIDPPDAIKSDSADAAHTAAPGAAAVDRARAALRDVSAGPASAVPDAAEGVVIAGKYKLLQRIGEGGMGEVWMAGRRGDFHQMVAVKLIKPGMDTKQVLARFEAERQALAIMDHPNVARVFDGGRTERGYPFFVMELVRGLPLTRYCDERKMGIRDRVELAAQICSAVQHAHQKGIIHRDLKPSNILVTENDGTPVPKVIDFGLAKALAGGALTDQTLFTAYGSTAGTPQYMAPEQVGINAIDVDTRADVYALGVILYELLTGTTPLAADEVRRAAWDEVSRAIREQDPPRPSTRVTTSADLRGLAVNRQIEPARLGGLLRGELDWIVMRRLEKDRRRRYDSAADLAADLRRHLAGEPVVAAPPGAVYRISKFARRNRTTVAATVAVAAALLAGLAGTTWQWRRAAEASARQQARATVAERQRKVVVETMRELSAAGGPIASLPSSDAGGFVDGFRTSPAYTSIPPEDRGIAEMAAVARSSVTGLGDALKAAEAARAAAERNQRIADTTADFLLNILATNESGYADQTTVLSAIDRAARELDRTLKDDPMLQATARSAIGRSYSRIGRWDRARELLEQALPVLEQSLGPTHKQVRTALMELASVALSKGEPDAAERYLRRLLEVNRGLPDRDVSRDLLRPTRKLAQVYLERGDVATAERITADVVKDLGVNVESIRKLSDLPQADQSVHMMHMLAAIAECRLRRGRLDDAERLYRLTLEMFENGGYPVQEAWTWADLGRVALARGRVEEARALLGRAKPQMEARFGAEHFRVRQLNADLDECGRRLSGKPATRPGG